jgi:hypothetical protein
MQRVRGACTRSEQQERVAVKSCTVSPCRASMGVTCCALSGSCPPQPRPATLAASRVRRHVLLRALLDQKRRCLSCGALAQRYTSRTLIMYKRATLWREMPRGEGRGGEGLDGMFAACWGCGWCRAGGGGGTRESAGGGGRQGGAVGKGAVGKQQVVRCCRAPRCVHQACMLLLCIRLACSCCASGLHAPVVSLPVLVRRACPLVCCKQTLLPHATSALGTHRLYHRQREG